MIQHKTKADELAVLDATITALGAASYLGPWLASVRAEVARDVTSDLIPMLLPSAALAQARGLLADAETRRAQLVAAGEAEADRIRAQASTEVAQIRQHAVTGLRGALAALGVRS